MRHLVTTLIIASPWLALFAIWAHVSDTPPGWYLLALAAAILTASAVLAGIAHTIATHDQERT